MPIPAALLEKILALPLDRLGEVEDSAEFLNAKSRRLAALDRLLAIAPALQAAGIPEMSMDEINDEVAAARAERRAGPGVPLRIVLDKNVVLSALLWRGTPYRLLQNIREREGVGLFSSATLLDELSEVLTRPSLATRLALLRVTAHQVLADYAGTAELVTPIATPRIIADDPDDDHVIAAAVAAGADIVASGDRHLLSLGTHQGIRIIGPAGALAEIVT